MDLTKLDDLRLAMKLAGIKPRHELGQNFLIDADTLRQIVDAGSLEPTDTVLEIGPGLGTMTGLLAAQSAQVVAVESDQKLAELLRKSAPANVEVVPADILRYNLSQLPSGYKVVANIPYYLTSKILRTLTEAIAKPAVIVLLIQKEVAERVCAKPGELSILGLSVQYYAKAEIIAVVGREKFWPAPDVDSAILRITPFDKPVFEADIQKLFRLIKAGFGEKRKMLKNSLAGGLNGADELVAQVLASADVDGHRRAQELSLSDWQRLYNEAVKHNLI